MISDDYDGENRNILYSFKKMKKCVIHVYKKSLVIRGNGCVKFEFK